MHKKLIAPIMAATMALGLAAAPANAQSSINFDFGLSSLPSLSSSRGSAPAPAPKPVPQKTRGQVAAEMKQRIIAANLRLGQISRPFGVAVNPATGEYYVAIAALIR